MVGYPAQGISTNLINLGIYGESNEPTAETRVGSRGRLGGGVTVLGSPLFID